MDLAISLFIELRQSINITAMLRYKLFRKRFYVFSLRVNGFFGNFWPLRLRVNSQKVSSFSHVESSELTVFFTFRWRVSGAHQHAPLRFSVQPFVRAYDTAYRRLFAILFFWARGRENCFHAPYARRLGRLRCWSSAACLSLSQFWALRTEAVRFPRFQNGWLTGSRTKV